MHIKTWRIQGDMWTVYIIKTQKSNFFYVHGIFFLLCCSFLSCSGNISPDSEFIIIDKLFSLCGSLEDLLFILKSFTKTMQQVGLKFSYLVYITGTQRLQTSVISLLPSHNPLARHMYYLSWGLRREEIKNKHYINACFLTSHHSVQENIWYDCIVIS